MARIKRYDPDKGEWVYADAAAVAGGGGSLGAFSNEEDVIPLQDLPEMAFDSDFQCYSTTVTQLTEFAIGETYYVLWDDNEIFTCVAQDLSSLISGTVAIGNLTSFGLSGNNEPFVIAVPADKSATAYYSTVDTAPTVHSVRVYQVVDKILQVVDNEVKAVPLAESAVATFIDNYIEEALGGDY